MDKFEYEQLSIPSNLKIINVKNSTIFLISLVIEILNILINLCNFENLDYKIKTIIILSLTCAILFIDIIILYIKNRENYYLYTYQDNMYKMLNNHLFKINERISSLEKAQH